MSTSEFRVVMRGYDPAQVDSRVRGLEEEIARLRADLPKLRAPKQEEPVEAPATPSAYDHLSRRMLQILDLADEEADEIRAEARAVLEDAREEAITQAAVVAEQARIEADQIRVDAETEGAELVEAARRRAADLMDASDREAAARRREAESLVERQRLAVVQANEEFERNIAERRAAADRTFRETEAEYRQRLDALSLRIAHQQEEAEAARAEAREQARGILSEAQEHAAELVEHARVTAERLRADAEREVQVAMQRRDALNQQLADLRGMLASLTSSAPHLRDVSAR